MKELKNIIKVDNQFGTQNQYLLENDMMKIFQSYDGIIAVYSKEIDMLIIYKDWDYSRTTLKYLYEFINYCFEYDYRSQYKELASDLKWTNKKKQIIEKWINENKIKYESE